MSLSITYALHSSWLTRLTQHQTPQSIFSLSLSALEIHFEKKKKKRWTRKRWMGRYYISISLSLTYLVMLSGSLKLYYFSIALNVNGKVCANPPGVKIIAFLLYILIIWQLQPIFRKWTAVIFTCFSWTACSYSQTPAWRNNRPYCPQRIWASGTWGSLHFGQSQSKL